MRFPLGLVVDYLTDEGFEVLTKPPNLTASFNWVIAGYPSAESSSDELLHVTRIGASAPGKELAIFISEGGFEMNRAQNSHRDNALVIAGKDDTTPELVANLLQMKLLAVYQWVEAMHKALADHCSCTELLRLSEPLLGHYISVTDSTFAYIAHTPDIGPLEEASRHLVEHGRYSDDVIETACKSGLTEFWTQPRPFKTFESNAINPLPCIEHVYHLNSQYAAHLVMVSEAPITQGEEFLFSLLIGPVETVLNGLWRMERPLLQNYTTFLSQLVQGSAGNREHSSKRATSLGIPLEGAFKVMVVNDAWKGGSASYFAQRAAMLIPECWTIAEGELLIILMHAENKTTGILAQHESKIIDLVKGLGTATGISRKFSSLHGVSQAVDEARIALRYGALHYEDYHQFGFAKANDSVAFRFKRYFPFYVGDPDDNKPDFSRRYNIAAEVFGRMELDDEENGTDNLRLLCTYLRTSCQVGATARTLGLHRNSITSRLRRIEKTYGFNLDNPDDVVFLCTLSIMSR